MSKAIYQLKDEVAVVTGASQGLGEHLSRELASKGAHVVLAARNQERLETVRSQIEQNGGTALAVPTDLTSEEDCQKLLDVALERFGKIDILVLNAGSATLGKLEELQTFAPIRNSMATNFFGAAYPTYLFLKHLIESRGAIAYVTSGGGHLPMAGYLGYTTSKHAMNGFFEALRLELAPHGVDVIAINPGDMYSDDGAGRTVIGPEGAEHKVDLSVKRSNDIARIPASEVAKKCLEGILDRQREVDLSPAKQKLATRLRPIMPKLVDRQLAAQIAKMRAAFTS